jgi:YfiH family protein
MSDEGEGTREVERMRCEAGLRPLSSSLVTRHSSPGVAFRFPGIGRLPLRHAMSGRAAGAACEGDLGHRSDTEPELIEANRRAFLAAAGVGMRDLVICRQTHSSNVRQVTAADRGRGLYPAFDGFPDTDGMVTDDPTVALGVIVADCVPLLLYDARLHALGLLHAGWRGTVAGIAVAGVRAMTAAFGTRPEDIVAGIGPSIGPCCYEVGDEVASAWTDAGVAGGSAALVRRDTSYHFDLWTANRRMLLAAGVRRDRIEDSGVCVRCMHERFFSHRATRRNGVRPGRNLMVAQL